MDEFASSGYLDPARDPEIEFLRVLSKAKRTAQDYFNHGLI
jgi:hypothetical protein